MQQTVDLTLMLLLQVASSGEVSVVESASVSQLAMK